MEVLVGAVSEVKKARDNEKHCPQLELPCPWGLGCHLQTRHHYAFQFATPSWTRSHLNIQQPCEKISLWQVGLRRDGKNVSRQKERMTKIENNLAAVLLEMGEEGRRTEKYVTVPHFIWGPSQTPSAVLKYLTMFPNETNH